MLQFFRRARRRRIPDAAALNRRAEAFLVRECQQRYFRKEISDTKVEHQVQATSKLSSFQLFLDGNDVLRARTRLTVGISLTDHCIDDEDNPVIVPGESMLARLIFIVVHPVNAHFGISMILSRLCRKFRMTRARQIAKSALNKCVVFRRRQGKHATQLKSQLPDFPAGIHAPFSTAELDFRGPFLTRHRKVKLSKPCPKGRRSHAIQAAHGWKTHIRRSTSLSSQVFRREPCISNSFLR